MSTHGVRFKPHGFHLAITRKPLSLDVHYPLERFAKGDIAPMSTAISAGVAAAKGMFKSSFTDRLMWRLRKPELLWVNDLVDQAHHLTEAMPNFSRIWEIPPNRQAIFAKRFQKMALLVS
jgi:hypothetical protein